MSLKWSKKVLDQVGIAWYNAEQEANMAKKTPNLGKRVKVELEGELVAMYREGPPVEVFGTDLRVYGPRQEPATVSVRTDDGSVIEDIPYTKITVVNRAQWADNGDIWKCGERRVVKVSENAWVELGKAPEKGHKFDTYTDYGVDCYGFKPMEVK